MTSKLQSDEPTVPTDNLWVGNLSNDVTDSDLAALFNKHGAIDIVKKTLPRSYAFVAFKSVEDAKAARDALQATVLKGLALKIEFAKPAKQCKSLWVGGIAPSVTKDVLEERFARFGELQDFKFLRDRNTALVDYVRIEDATEALKKLNGLRIGGNQIRVDYLRSQPTRREQLPEFRDSGEVQSVNRRVGIPDLTLIPHDTPRNYSDPAAHYMPRRAQNFQSSGDPNVDGLPTNVLRVCYPPSSVIDEQMLHNAMILFGEIERIKSEPARNSLYVEFRSVEEATLAKEGLEGRLFNDPRILITYYNSEVEPNKDQSGLYSGIQRPNMFSKDLPFQTGVIGTVGQNHLVPNSFPGHPLPDNMRKPLGAELNDLVKLPNRKRLSPAPGVLSSSLPAINSSSIPVSGSWDVFDVSKLQREPKRSRTGGHLATFDSSLGRMDVRASGFEYHDGGFSGAPMDLRGTNFSPLSERAGSGGTGQGHPEVDYIWRGVIAKGGSHVCRARCVLVEKDFSFEIPEVVNCSARTGLDMLTKHIGDSAGLNIIYFLPNSVEDFDSYTEFVRFLGAKNRAGVAKFDDGNTLFLVPPSDFLTKVLNISGPERLYGVVLKFPQQVPGSASELPHLSQQHYSDRPVIPRTENIVMPQEDKILQTDYNRALQKTANSPSKSLGPSTINSLIDHGSQPIGTAAPARAGISLTPELIATLASLIPARLNSSGAQAESRSSMLRPMSSPLAVSDRNTVHEQSGEHLNQTVQQYNPQSQLPSQHYFPVLNTHDGSAQGLTQNAQIQDSTVNMMQHGSNTSRRATNFSNPLHSEQFSVNPQDHQQYQVENPQDIRNVYDQGTNGFGLYTASVRHPNTISAMSSHQVHDAIVSHQQSGFPMTGETIGLEPRNQVQQPHSSHSISDQCTSEAEADKRKSYQTTLQLAANLLLRVQQNRQHPGAEAVQGSGND